MFDYPNKSEPMFQFSVKLCSAVRKHECIYLQKSPTPKIVPPEWEASWKEVAEECGESVENCKWRWTNIRKSFLRSLHRNTNKYYLHKYMEFLVPHLLLIKKYDNLTDVNVSNGEGETNENVDEYNAESDSDTTSADETHILKAEINKKLQDEICSSQTEKVGDFLINEIDEGGSSSNKNDQQDDDDDDMDESIDTIRSRLRYRRACKRGLDAELTNELNTEEKQEEKRPRRSVERRKDLSDVALEELGTQRKSLSNTKKIEVKVNKIKFNKTLSTQPKCVEPQPVLENNSGYKSIAVNTATSVNTYYPKKSQENINHLTESPISTNHMKTSTNILYDSNLILPKNPPMVDVATLTDLHTRDSYTQYESSEQESLDFDDTFINSLKPQLKLMNGRQKMNFKRKVFNSLMEVFDDAANFPNTNEYIVLPPTGAPRFDNTTTGELRLMRELVSLVQAAKTTPEIISATDNVAIEKPSTPKIPEAPKTSSPLLLSPTFDDDDLSFLNGTLIDDRESLPSSLDEIIDLRGQDDVLGLPRRIIHKVVKVAGSNGSTIVTGEGKQRRVYRIYPKAANLEANRAINTKNNATNTNATNIGTFYVTPSKIANSTTTSSETQNPTNRPKSNTPNFTFRAVNKSSINNSRETFIATHATNRSLGNAAPNKTPNTNKGRITPILNQATGLFTIPSPASKTPSSSNNNQTKSPMLPPSVSSALFANSNANKSSMRIVSVKSNTNSAETKNQNNIMQRRYSICGPATAATNPIPVIPKAQTKPFIQKVTYSTNGNPVKSAVSNIMISKPVSLKPTSTNSLTNVKSFLANTSKNASSPTTENNLTNKRIEPIPLNEEKSVSTTKTATSKTPSESQQPTKQHIPEIPILETAGTIAADTFNDPLFVNPTNKSAADTLDDPLCVKTTIKSEPLD